MDWEDKQPAEVLVKATWKLERKALSTLDYKSTTLHRSQKGSFLFHLVVRFVWLTPSLQEKIHHRFEHAVRYRRDPVVDKREHLRGHRSLQGGMIVAKVRTGSRRAASAPPAETERRRGSGDETAASVSLLLPLATTRGKQAQGGRPNCRETLGAVAPKQTGTRNTPPAPPPSRRTRWLS